MFTCTRLAGAVRLSSSQNTFTVKKRIIPIKVILSVPHFSLYPLLSPTFPIFLFHFSNVLLIVDRSPGVKSTDPPSGRWWGSMNVYGGLGARWVLVLVLTGKESKIDLERCLVHSYPQRLYRS